MRPAHAAAAAVLPLVMAAMVVAGAGMLEPDGPLVTVDPIAVEDLQPAAAIPAQPPDDSIAGGPAGETPLERIAPRAPLSDLSLAVAPKPKAPEDLAGKPLFRPVAEAAGVIRVKGQALTVSGIDVVEPDEICTDGDGTNWPCGARARAAFRSFLRGRAVTCAAPGKEGAAQCRVGGKDIGEWLVENGWARAAAGGPYAETGDKAEAGHKGIFGTAPDLSGLPPAPLPAVPAPEGRDSILDLSGEAEPATPVPPPAPAE